MAKAKDSAQWNHTSAEIATAINRTLDPKEKAVDADAIHPYRKESASSGKSKIKLTAANLHLLKNLPGVRS